MLVRGVVVGDQVQRLVLRGLAVDLAQELQPLDMGVVLLARPALYPKKLLDFFLEPPYRG